MEVETSLEGYAVEEFPHVEQRVYGDADLAHLAEGELVVGVAAHLRREVEGHGEAGLAVLREVLEAGVGLPRGPEARVLAHRPRPPPVHARVGAAGVRVTRRVPEPRSVVEASARSSGP